MIPSQEAEWERGSGTETSPHCGDDESWDESEGNVRKHRARSLIAEQKGDTETPDAGNEETVRLL